MLETMKPIERLLRELQRELRFLRIADSLLFLNFVGAASRGELADRVASTNLARLPSLLACRVGRGLRRAGRIARRGTVV